MRIGVCAAVIFVLATACGQSGSGPTPDNGSSTLGASSTRAAGLTGPPPLTLLRPEGKVGLPAYAWCYFSDSGVSGCADGAPPAHPPQTSATSPLIFTFPLKGWAFTASFRRPGPHTECERSIQADVVAQSDGTFIVPAIVPAGRWEVQISGNADGGGSLATALGWITSADSKTTPPARGGRCQGC